MKHGSLFSGIGGFDLAAEWMGWDNEFHCEWAEFPRKILHHYWPNAISYHDVTQTDFTAHANQINILTGGFPCQPYSAAGKRKGKDDDRHLWPHMLRAIREIRPRWVVGENVFGLTTWNGGVVLEEVCAELEAEGYSVQPFIIPACAVNAPHRRDRVWFVANATGTNDRGTFGNIRGTYEETQKSCITKPAHPNVEGIASNASSEGLCTARQSTELGRQRFGFSYAQNDKPAWEDFPTVTPICGGDDGIPRELDGITFPKWRNESIKGYGNAIVPQVALQIFRAIAAIESHS